MPLCFELCFQLHTLLMKMPCTKREVGGPISGQCLPCTFATGIILAVDGLVRLRVICSHRVPPPSCCLQNHSLFDKNCARHNSFWENVHAQYLSSCFGQHHYKVAIRNWNVNITNVWNVIANNNLNISWLKPYLWQQVSPLEEVGLSENVGIMCTSWPSFTAYAPETRNQEHAFLK